MTAENGNEGSINLAMNPEQVNVGSVKSNTEKFADKMASLRGQGNPKIEKSTTIDNSKQAEPGRVVEAEDTKPVNKSSNDDQFKLSDDNKKFKYTREEGKIKGLERKNREREQRIATLEAELAKFKGVTKTRDQYESDMDFIQDLSERKAQEVTLNREYQTEKSAKENDEREIYFEQVANQVENPEKYHQRAQKHAADIDDITNDYVFKSPVGFKMLDAILEKFEETPEAKSEFLNMPVAKKHLLLVNLERYVTEPNVSNTIRSDEQKVSKAPTSIAPIKGEKISEPVDTKSRFQQKINQIRAGYSR